MLGKLPSPIFPQSTLISRDIHWFVGAESWPAVKPSPRPQGGPWGSLSSATSFVFMNTNLRAQTPPRAATGQAPSPESVVSRVGGGGWDGWEESLSSESSLLLPVLERSWKFSRLARTYKGETTTESEERAFLFLRDWAVLRKKQRPFISGDVQCWWARASVLSHGYLKDADSTVRDPFCYFQRSGTLAVYPLGPEEYPINKYLLSLKGARKGDRHVNR